MVKTILVTGYGPFRDVKVNPSWEAVKDLPTSLNGCKIIILEFPVNYDYVSQNIPKLIKQHSPSFILHFGVGQGGAIRLEKVGHNIGYFQTDIDGKVPKDGICINQPDAKEVNHTSLDIEAAVLSLKNAGFKDVEPSEDAGRYLCEFALATSLYHLKSGNVTFVHVPPIPFPYSQKELKEAALSLLHHFTTI